jgi:hypothetical protein
MHKVHVMKLTKNKKNKKRFVFLLFLPETDAFPTRIRLEVPGPCFCENSGPTIGMSHLHKYNKFAYMKYIKPVMFHLCR